MKRMLGIVLAIFSLGINGCISFSYSRTVIDSSTELPFDEWFFSNSFYTPYDNIDDVYDYVIDASAKFSRSVNKPSLRSAMAKINGPAITEDAPVSLYCMIKAEDDHGEIDLSNSINSLEFVLKHANSAVLTFLIFYEDRAISISNFHLKEGYKYNEGYDRYNTFDIEGIPYIPTYFIGWTVDTAFQYLDGQID
ncbi:hypothetical protein AGMMS49546_30190 [Spirochaetia bacterium]|nr:hypothetical protein AGMMS49546_30190 [Spirochaetia bacterium]